VTLAEAITSIESNEFAARVGVASDWNNLVAALENADAVVDVLRDPSNARRIAERVVDLASREVDPRYENPLDFALTAYIVVLSRLDRSLAELAAAVVLRIPQLWWASKVARQTLLEAKTASTAAIHNVAPERPVVSDNVPAFKSAHNSDRVIFIIPVIARNVQSIASCRLGPNARASSSALSVYGAMVISLNNAVHRQDQSH